MPGWIKHTEETVYRIWVKWFKGILEWNNQKNRGEPFRSSMYWDLWKIGYYRIKVFGGIKLFEKTTGIRRFERMVCKADCAFGEGNWMGNKEKEKEI